HKKRAAGEAVGTTGHQWDEDLAEYNNPLPKWWMWLFWITIVFGLVYLALYPGLGAFKGILGWSSTGQYQAEQASADTTYGPVFRKYAAMDIEAIAKDPKAKAMGERLFLTYCSQCHGSDARGAKGFPNLADNDWLWGGAPENILTTILEGRTGNMPPMGAAVGGPEGVKEVASYVLSLSGAAHDAKLAEAGKAKFAACAACHGPEAKGNPALGAPNLTDGIWLHGGSLAAISEQIDKGRVNVMPAHREFLGPERSRILAAYVWGLSQGAGAK
ncbi:MAG: cytochrome-c oxidase, cbb3-type subunit III, partial [Betaproteobacteria bacterium]|nr:cytochrome-c oxidase, cbb3-type subunit III [Betaproteobacteria bacterium]